jgi:HSP20 family protein
MRARWRESHGRSFDERFARTLEVNVRAFPDAWIVTADLPGTAPKDVEITAFGNELVVRGCRPGDDSDVGDAFALQERWSGSFVRTIALPEGVDPDRIRAELSDGVLTISVPCTRPSYRRIAISRR